MVCLALSAADSPDSFSSANVLDSVKASMGLHVLLFAE